MGRTLSSDEVEAEFLAALGPTLGPVFHELRTDVITAHWEWRQYRALFAESPERIELLNDVAGPFFGMLHSVLFDNTVMHLSRLMEGPEVGRGRHPVLGLPQLPPLIVDASVREEVEALITEAKSKCEPMRRWRHDRLAHRSLALALQSNRDTGISRQSVEEAFESVRAVMNRIQEHYGLGHTHYQGMKQMGDADCLCAYLKRGMDSFARRQDRFASGQLLPHDLEP